MDVGHRVIELSYEFGLDDGEPATGYAVIRDKDGAEISRGGFYTDGVGRFVFSRWHGVDDTPGELVGDYDWLSEGKSQASST